MLQREERNANIFLALCFFAFFFFAFYIAQRRVANSNTSTYIVTPVYRAATFVPRRMLRLVGYVTRVAFRKSSPPVSPEPAVPNVIGSDAEPSARQPDVPAVETTKSPGLTTEPPAVASPPATGEIENDEEKLMSSTSGEGSDRVVSESDEQESGVVDEAIITDPGLTEPVHAPARDGKLPPLSDTEDDGLPVGDYSKEEL